MTDAWDDEGFGPEDDWEGSESVESDLEDDALEGFDEVDEAEPDDDAPPDEEDD